ncbi:hypothetical protein GGI07_002833 [Coemansia sp. Benny D115]|nr:hypothetical protein GGI07_002833 [Coemansia sp. Benny D115]
MSSNNYQSDDEATKAELAKFDCMVDDGIICISDSESEKGSHGNKDKGKDRGQGDGDDKDGVQTVTLSDVLSVPGQLLEKALLTTFVLEETWFVASSANLLQIDWTVLGNIVFIQDFPLAEAPMVKELCGFSADLAAALRDLSVPEPVVEQLLRVDFSLARAHIVTSVPSAAGRSKFHTNAYGISRLHQVCEGMWKSWDHDKQTVALTNTTLYCYGSSMGRLNDRYLRDFYLRALGLTDETHRMLYKKATGKYATIEHMASHVLVGFPTKAQALANPFGELAAESIKFQKQFYDNPDYPVNNLRKIKPTVPGCLMHSKVILARCGPTEGWIYLGSHNFTPGAWGHAKYGTRNAYVNNYEFGVILPDVTFESVFGRDSVMWNGTSVPLPFALDWQPYAEDDVPFLFDP